jgi:NTE family protein
MFLADSPYSTDVPPKEDSRAFPAQWTFGLKRGLQVPTGLNPGQRVQWLLNRITLPYGTLESFDDLPTPFRCVATDLNKSEVVVMDRGSLATAMRATMAIPGVFTPVALGDRLLVDGGTLDNIPADVVRAMGADIVIAVDVSADYDGKARKESVSMFEVLGRTIDTMMYSGVRVSLKQADLILEPDLSKLSATDWRKSDELADRGRDAAAAKSDALRHALTSGVAGVSTHGRRACANATRPSTRSRSSASCHDTAVI